MPLFAILILSSVPYLVACSNQTQSLSADNQNLDAAFAQSPVKTDSVSDEKISSSKETAEKTGKESVAAITGKAIELPHYQPDFPPGPGKDLFISRCGVCHSLRYVTMQPDFPKKTWTKEVDKMVKTYGAHISKTEADEIIGYLNSIKGKPASAASH